MSNDTRSSTMVGDNGDIGEKNITSNRKEPEIRLLEADEGPPATADKLNLRFEEISGRHSLDIYVWRDRPLEKAMRLFARHIGGEVNHYRFLLEGDRIQMDSTPNELQMEHGDQIDVFAESLGGVAHAAVMCSREQADLLHFPLGLRNELSHSVNTASSFKLLPHPLQQLRHQHNIRIHSPTTNMESKQRSPDKAHNLSHPLKARSSAENETFELIKLKFIDQYRHRLSVAIATGVPLLQGLDYVAHRMGKKTCNVEFAAGGRKIIAEVDGLKSAQELMIKDGTEIEVWYALTETGPQVDPDDLLPPRSLKLGKRPEEDFERA